MNQQYSDQNPHILDKRFLWNLMLVTLMLHSIYKRYTELPGDWKVVMNAAVLWHLKSPWLAWGAIWNYLQVLYHMLDFFLQAHVEFLYITYLHIVF